MTRMGRNHSNACQTTSITSPKSTKPSRFFSVQHGEAEYEAMDIQHPLLNEREGWEYHTYSNSSRPRIIVADSMHTKKIKSRSRIVAAVGSICVLVSMYIRMYWIKVILAALN